MSKSTEKKSQNKIAVNNPWALGYHIQPKKGWMNDPNGLCYYKGRFHVFFQHHPDSPKWGSMHWGHVSSDDLIHWIHHPIALFPGEEGMCFSGSSVNIDDSLALIYTGHKWLKEDHNDDYMEQVQCLAVSHDGIHFEKQGIIIDKAYNSEIINFRDPKVWQEDEQWHMVVGVKENNQGKIAYYRSDDLKKWDFINILSSADKMRDEGYMWECPDFFKLDSNYILLCSPQGMSPKGSARRNLFQNGYFIGSFNKHAGEFIRGDFVELDYGHDFYACQTFVDDQNRRIALAWMDMWESEMPEKKYGRVGALTIPRQLTINDKGHIYQTPVEELKALRTMCLVQQDNTRFELGRTNLSINATQAEIQFSLKIPAQTQLSNDEKMNSFERAGILFRCGNAQYTYVGYDAMTQCVFLDRNNSGEGVNGIRYSPKIDTEVNEYVIFQIFLDSSSVEVFINNGQYTLTSRIYPNEENQGLEFMSENGQSHIKDLVIYQLASPMTEASF